MSQAANTLTQVPIQRAFQHQGKYCTLYLMESQGLISASSISSRGFPQPARSGTLQTPAIVIIEEANFRLAFTCSKVFIPAYGAQLYSPVLIVLVCSPCSMHSAGSRRHSRFIMSAKALVLSP